MEEERIEVEINRIKEVLDKKEVPKDEAEIIKKLKEKSEKDDSLKSEKDLQNLGEGIKVIPKKSTRRINMLIYIFSFLALVLLIFAIYLFSIKNIDSKKDSTPVKIKEVTKVVVKEKVIPKIVDLNNSNFKKYYNSLKFKTLKCYSFRSSQTQLPKECAKNIDKFIKNNSSSVKFEIIPVIGESDNLLFNKINLEKVDKKLSNKIKEYLMFGLSKQRVLDTTFYIKEKFGKDTIVVPTNYFVKSTKDNKGIIIKAYYSK